MSSEKGQTLIELIVVISVSILVVGALVFATIASLRNASFSKNQAQATKLAQAGLEKVRSLRDRDTDNSIVYNAGSTAFKFSELWPITLSCGIGGSCYFYFNSLNQLKNGTSTDFESIAPYFERQFFIENNGPEQKKVTVIVRWTDFAGPHESRLTTILRKI